MHDCTEGGLVAALNELADVSDLGFQLEREKILINPKTRLLQEYYNLSEIELLSMSSTGSIIAAINPKEKNKITKTMSKLGIRSEIIGKFTQNAERVISKNNENQPFPRIFDDPYNKILFG
jgi:hydrogenase maturation factor